MFGYQRQDFPPTPRDIIPHAMMLVNGDVGRRVIGSYGSIGVEKKRSNF